MWKLVKLNFGRSPAHFGDLGIGIEQTSERVRSDSLFSAWMSSYARLWGKEAIEEVLQKFLKQSPPPVRMSSTFIYRQDNEQTIYYLPRPLKFPIGYPHDDDLKFFKTYKKLNYLPLPVWQRWYQGQGFTHQDAQELIEKTQRKSSQGDLEKLGTFDYKDAFKIHKQPKIAVDRVTRATNLYHTGFVQFATGENHSGLYFLLYFALEDASLEKNLQTALNLLGEDGLGGERSSGAGRFQAEWLELAKPWHDVVNFSGGTHHTLMSLFWELPLADEFLAGAAYDIQERGGWIASPFSGRQLRRQFIRMFAEGSVFQSIPQGKLADVTPEGFTTHPIYRSGISLSLPIKAKDE